jgi:hypothetical protein
VGKHGKKVSGTGETSEKLAKSQAAIKDKLPLTPP